MKSAYALLFLLISSTAFGNLTTHIERDINGCRGHILKNFTIHAQSVARSVERFLMDGTYDELLDRYIETSPSELIYLTEADYSTLKLYSVEPHILDRVASITLTASPKKAGEKFVFEVDVYSDHEFTDVLEGYIPKKRSGWQSRPPIDCRQLDYHVSFLSKDFYNRY